MACPACQGREIDPFKQWRLPGKQARVYGCRACGLLFVHPQPAQEELNAYYAPDGGWKASRVEKSDKPPQTRTKGAAPALFEALDKYFAASSPAPGSRIFDFGCGPGTWLNSFQDRGWDTFGLEPSDDSAFVRHTRLGGIPAEPQFDLVLAYHVLEHLPRPLDTMRELVASLRPGGHFLVSVPRLDTLAVHRQVDYCLHPRHHIVGFTEACLRGLFVRAGLGVLASFHELDARFSKGEPVRLRVLGRKGAPAEAGADAAVAMHRVIGAYVELRTSAARVDEASTLEGRGNTST